MSEEIRKSIDEDRSQRNSSVDYIAARWFMLPPHIREAVITLIGTTLPDNGRFSLDVDDETTNKGEVSVDGY